MPRTAPPPTADDGSGLAANALELERLYGAVRHKLFGDEVQPITIAGKVILGRIGSGGVGVVYAAYDAALDRKVAIKLVDTASHSEGVADGLQAEARALARLSNDNVVHVYEVGVRGSQLFIVMEYVDGPNLRAWVAGTDGGDGRPAWRTIVAAMVAAGRGLSAAHAQGLVHRDFKPDNVLVVVEPDARPEAKVVDFGLATLIDAPAQGFEGTVPYMAPEQIERRPVSAATDQFSFCVALYEALCGQRPFAADTPAAMLDEIRAGPKLRRPEIPRALRGALARGLSFQAEDRYPSMEGLLARLQRPLQSRRGGWVLLGITGAAATFAVISAAQTPDPCAGVEAALAEVWAPSRSDELRAAFGFNPDAAQRVSTAVDAYAAAWSAARVDVCRAGQAQQSPAIAQLRITCLDRRLAQLDAWLRSTLAADTRGLTVAAESVHHLSPLSVCEDVDALRAAVVPPQDKPSRRRVAALTRRLDEARAQKSIGQFIPARDAAETIAAEAADVGYAPLRAEALLMVATVDTYSARPDAIGRLHEAVAAAETGAHRIVKAEATRRLAFELMRVGDPEAERWAAHALAAQARLRPTAQLQVHALRLQAVLAPDAAMAQTKLTEALRLAEASWGRTDLRVAQLLTEVGLRRVADEPDLAVGQLQRALQIRIGQLLPGHPDVGVAHMNFASVLARLGRHAEALEHVELVEQVALYAAGDLEHAGTERLLTTRGFLRAKVGRMREAREDYDDALRIAERTYGPDHDKVVEILESLAAAERLSGDESLAQRAEARAETIVGARVHP